MPRITKDDLEYCVEFNKCCDCYMEEKDVKALVSSCVENSEFPAAESILRTMQEK